jgi:uncharacterized protein (DUF1778 family)
LIYVHLYLMKTTKPTNYDLKDARFDTRLSKEQKIHFERAANLGGFRNLTDFVVFAVNEKANEIISKHEQILQSKQDQELFFNALTNPPAPNEALLKAVSDYKELNG